MGIQRLIKKTMTCMFPHNPRDLLLPEARKKKSQIIISGIKFVKSVDAVNDL